VGPKKEGISQLNLPSRKKRRKKKPHKKTGPTKKKRVSRGEMFVTEMGIRSRTSISGLRQKVCRDRLYKMTKVITAPHKVKLGRGVFGKGENSRGRRKENPKRNGWKIFLGVDSPREHMKERKLGGSLEKKSF